nr:hypothetical protein Iba_chr11fCG12790 [Ipomoea batatas]
MAHIVAYCCYGIRTERLTEPAALPELTSLFFSESLPSSRSNISCSMRFMRNSWDKLSNRCLRARFSMLNMRFCWSRNSSSDDIADSSTCGCQELQKEYDFGLNLSCFSKFKCKNQTMKWRYLHNLDRPLKFSYVLKFSNS